MSGSHLDQAWGKPQKFGKLNLGTSSSSLRPTPLRCLQSQSDHVTVAVGFALGGSIPLTVGVVGHEGSTVVVVMNSLRLLLGRSQKSG